jgi:hypothetical protein
MISSTTFWAAAGLPSSNIANASQDEKTSFAIVIADTTNLLSA